MNLNCNLKLKCITIERSAIRSASRATREWIQMKWIQVFSELNEISYNNIINITNNNNNKLNDWVDWLPRLLGRMYGCSDGLISGIAD